MPPKRQVLKIIILGDSGVGKTSLMQQYVNHKFDNRYKATIGADFLSKDIEINGQVVTLQIWDTAGQERFQSLGSAFYRGADACILVFDVTQSESFAHLGSWLEEFSIQAGCRDSVLIGNKTDLNERRRVSTKTAQMWCAKQNMNNSTGSNIDSCEMKYFEASAKENISVDDAFLAVSTAALARKVATEEEMVERPETIVLSSNRIEEEPRSLCNC
ncbi:unnamed protein product [Phytomonas sp. Hart1]|nr:unnamed protein product [Phytomonas sp. Hart1]|eukprot:CCW66006.1 unnamed protein product [Phytomonas sp. isolate Hart1]